jgi:hypothetical protein
MPSVQQVETAEVVDGAHDAFKVVLHQIHGPSPRFACHIGVVICHGRQRDWVVDIMAFLAVSLIPPVPQGSSIR